MLKIISKNKGSLEEDIANKFRRLDVSEFPDFYSYKNPLEMGLWILWVAKEKLQIRKMTAEQIACVIRDVKEISIEAKSITYSFTPAKDKVHIHHKNKKVYFEIMKPGKDYLLSSVKKELVEVFYFEPDRKYSTKRMLSKIILEELEGELKIVDPYCGERTLDILKDLQSQNVKFLTRLQNLRERERNSFIRELQDFKSEYPSVEFREYPLTDIHDRYVLSKNSLIILGHSLKDLGSKESFVVVLNKETSKNIVEAIIENFDRRWKIATPL